MDLTAKSKNLLNDAYLSKAVDYETYKKLVTDLLLQNQVTGPVQSESLVEYTRLNVFRMHRIEKTMKILPELRALVESITAPQTWLVLTEGWCGDAAQTLPVMNALAALNPNIRLLLLLRDENPDLMALYLTNGISNSIPVLIVYNASGEEMFHWGPRPGSCRKKFYEMKTEGMDFDDIKEEVHRWYAKDRTISTQQELGNLLNSGKQA